MDTEGDKGPPPWFLKQVGATKPWTGYQPNVPTPTFPQTAVITTPEPVITPSESVINNEPAIINNTQTVINNTNITAEKQPDSSQTVSQHDIATSHGVKNVLYSSTSRVADKVVPGSGLFSGEPTSPRPNAAAPMTLSDWH